LFGETACFGDNFELPVDILRVTLLSSTDTANDGYVVLRINSVNDAVVAELVLPIARQRPAQRQPYPSGSTASFFSKTFRS